MGNIIIDANTWVRFARNRNIRPLVNIIFAHDLTPVANKYLLSEIFDALVFKNWMPEKVAIQTILLIQELCFLTTEHAIYRLSPDSKDNYLFDLAIQYNCRFIISDDTKLLAFPLKPVPVKGTNWFFKNFPV